MTLEHISYSQYRTYKECPKSWYLGRLKGAESKQTWYSPIGTAVHNMIEEFIASDRPEPQDFPSAEHFLFPLLRKQMKIQPDLRQWWAGGPKADPTVGPKATELVQTCFERAVAVLRDAEILGVEEDLTGELPGCEVPVKAFADILGIHKKTKRYVILDWKSGMAKPKDNFQLETYMALGRVRVGTVWEDAEVDGYFIMLNPAARKDPWGKPIDLSQVKPGQIGALYQEVYESMKKRDYRANLKACYSCFVQESCIDKVGPTPQALYYDKAEEDGFPFE